MAYQLSDIIAKVQRRIRDTAYSSSEITEYINDTINDVYNEYRLPFMVKSVDFTVFPGVNDITNGVGLPNDFVQVYDLELTSAGYQSQLRYVDAETFVSAYPVWYDTTRYPSVIPTTWFKLGNVINVFPSPKDAMTVRLRYYATPTPLVNATDVPSIPAQFVELLVVGAAYRVLQVKDNYDQAGVLQNKFDELLQKLVVKYSVPQTAHALTMRINRNAVGKTFF